MLSVLPAIERACLTMRKFFADRGGATSTIFALSTTAVMFSVGLHIGVRAIGADLHASGDRTLVDGRRADRSRVVVELVDDADGEEFGHRGQTRGRPDNA